MQKTTDRFGKLNNAYLSNEQSNDIAIRNHSSLNPKTISLFAMIKVNNYYMGKCEVNQITGKGSPDDVNDSYFMRFKDICNDCDVTTPAKTDKEYFYGGFGDNNHRSSVQADTGFVQPGKWYTIIYSLRWLLIQDIYKW